VFNSPLCNIKRSTIAFKKVACIAFSLYFYIDQFKLLVSSRDQKKLCGECGNPYEEDEEVEWYRCNGCKQWYHGECLELSASAAEDQYFVFNSCMRCTGEKQNRDESNEDDIVDDDEDNSNESEEDSD